MIRQISRLVSKLLAIVYKATGRMQKDKDKRYLNNGDFLDSLNTRSITTLGGSTGDREIVDGNTFIWALDTVVLQNKIFRNYIIYNAVLTHTFRLIDPNGNILFTTGVILSGANLAATYTNMAAALNTSIITSFQTGNISALTATSATEGYFDIEITTIPGWEYDFYENNSISLPYAQLQVIQESVTADMLGEWHNIGGYDLEGEAYTWWTTRTQLPVILNITAIAAAGGAGSPFVITTDLPHNQVNGALISVIRSTVADGNWVIAATGATTMTLLGSVFVVGGTLGTVTTNFQGLGEVGHAVRDENTLLWTYVRLIRSKVFNFTTEKQVDTYCEKNAFYKGLYWTDDYNVPRVLYDRTQVYVNDALLTFIDPLNTYAYATLDLESVSITSSADISFNWTGQTQGGSVPSGNSRYAARGVTEENTFSDWSLLDTDVPAANATLSTAPASIFGDAPNIPTGKVNSFLVTGALLGVFEYIELAVVNYQGTAATGWIVGRFKVTGNSMTIRHTGNETATTDLDIGTIGVFMQRLATVKSIDALDGHLIYSNGTTIEEADLSAFFLTWTYSIRRTALFSTGSFISNTLARGEYQVPINVHQQASYMLNDRYRLGAVVRWKKTGGLSRAFFIDDITIDTNLTARKIATIPNYDLTTGAITAPQPYSFYIEWNSPNTNAIVDGQKISDLIDKIYIMRCPVDNPQVLASGVAIPAVSGIWTMGGTDMSYETAAVVIPTGKYGEFPIPAGITQVPFAPPNNPAYPAGFTPQRRFCSVYFADTFLGGDTISFTSGDQLNNLGQGVSVLDDYPTTLYNDYIGEFDGVTSQVALTQLTIDESFEIDKAGNATFVAAGAVYTKLLEIKPILGIDLFEYVQGKVLHLTADLNPLSANTDMGLYNIQYFREIVLADDQYGAKELSQYIYTGSFLDIDTSIPATFDTFGGDCFTQRTWFKNRYPQTDVLGQEGFGQGLGWYAQNRINFQMRQTDPTVQAFPNTTAQTWLNAIALETLIYQHGYDIHEDVQLIIAFDPDPESSNTDFPCRIWYSAKKQPESAQDAYRTFLPLNFKDLDYKHGEITSHLAINGELVTWQPDKFQRQFFNDTNLMTASGVEVVLGDGAALARRGIDLSTYGCSNKWSIIKGKSAGGKDTVYWIDKIRKLALRFGADGTVNISIIHGMDSWFQNRLRYIKDTPADGEGICGVWNERHKECIWTVRGWKTGVEEWQDPFIVEHDFTTFGAFRPYSNVVNRGTILYGVSAIGGAGTWGVLYEYNTTDGTYTDLFDMAIATGSAVVGDIIIVGDIIYGVASNGGGSGAGVIFSYDIASDIYTNLKSFNGTTEGDFPLSGLLHIAGVLYGVTYLGGTGFGTLFSWNIGTSTFTVLRNMTSNSRSNLVNIGTILYGTALDKLFSFNLTGSIYAEITLPANAWAGLTLSGTTLYGTTEVGGTGSLGTIFSFDTLTSTLTNLYNFSGVDGANPKASMILQGNNLVGTTQNGGVNNLGTIFVYNIITNTFQKIFDFTIASGNLPQSTLLFYNNKYWGTAADGGAAIGSDGTLFSFTFYGIGAAIQLGVQGFEQIPAYYQSLIDFNLTDPSIPTDPPTWELIPFSNYEYYNVYTIVFNEITNGFDGFYSFKPKIYLAWRNTFLSPRPISNTGTMYEHGRGLYSIFYSDSLTSQSENGIFSFIINALPDEIKKFYAIRCRTDIVPFRIDLFSSGGQQTFMVAADFEYRKLNFDCAVRNDTLTSSNGLNNNEDTSRLFGDYCEVQMTFQFGVYQKMYFISMRCPYIDPRMLKT